jgi:DNA-binding PadR family transcriptional regulator
VPEPRRSALAVAVLSMLTESPMHPYRMQQLVKERHKHDVINVSQRNSMYQTIQRLLRDGLIEVQSTNRTQNRPERTTYQITPTGRALLVEWLQQMLSTPVNEYPQFPAALSFLPNLSPEQALQVLAARADRLTTMLATADHDLALGAGFLPRLFLVETEYQRELLATELSYVHRLVDDLRAARLHWEPPAPDVG